MTARFLVWLFSGKLDRPQLIRDLGGAVAVVTVLFLLLIAISLFEKGGPLSSESLLGTPDDRERL